MCDDHSGVLVEIETASKRGLDGNKRAIDACLAPLVKLLNDGGIGTKASCCGHGKRPGTIILTDNRELLIIPDYETGRRLDKMFPDINGIDKLRIATEALRRISNSIRYATWVPTNTDSVVNEQIDNDNPAKQLEWCEQEATRALAEMGDADEA